MTKRQGISSAFGGINCAALYHALSDPQNVPLKGDSEFYRIISGKNLTSVLGVINELLKAIKCIT